MKFFFLKTDSLYKILKTLERIPQQKPVEIFIDPEHAFFDNPRWGKQVYEIIKKRNLNVVFLAEREYNRKFLQQLGLHVHEQQERLILKWIKAASLFIFNVRKFHLHAYNQQKLLFYMITIFEISVLLALFWIWFLFLIPSTTITIKVAQQKENIVYNFRYYPHNEDSYLRAIQQLSIPYYTWALDYTYNLAISTDNIHHINNPSAWVVKIYNRTPNTINLKPNTRFVTADGLTFINKEMLTIPAGSEDSASQLKTKLFAAELDENQVIMWIRGNIPAETKLRIKWLPESYYLNQLWAETLDDFTWGGQASLGLVSEKDHQILTQKLKDWVYTNKLSIVQSQFQKRKTLILLYDPLVKTTFHEVSIDSKIWEKATTLKWSVKVSFDFIYLNRDDVFKAFTQYIKQRQSDSIQLISIDPSTFTFLTEINPNTKQIDFRKFDEKVFSLPTKVSILQGYDFQRDIKSIQSIIKDLVVGKTVEEARKIILAYPEIASAKIDLGLLWGNTIPHLKSRVHIRVEI